MDSSPNTPYKKEAHLLKALAKEQTKSKEAERKVSLMQYQLDVARRQLNGKDQKINWLATKLSNTEMELQSALVRIHELESARGDAEQSPPSNHGQETNSGDQVKEQWCPILSVLLRAEGVFDPTRAQLLEIGRALSTAHQFQYGILPAQKQVFEGAEGLFKTRWRYEAHKLEWVKQTIRAFLETNPAFLENNPTA